MTYWLFVFFAAPLLAYIVGAVFGLSPEQATTLAIGIFGVLMGLTILRSVVWSIAQLLEMF
jgi:hypothetical protein